MDLGQPPYKKPDEVSEFTLDHKHQHHYSQWLMTTLRTTFAMLLILATVGVALVFGIGRVGHGEATPLGPSIKVTAPQSANHLAADNAEPGDTTIATSQSATNLTPNQLGSLALKQISYPWQDKLPDWKIQFIGRSEGPMGLTYTREQRIEIFVRPNQSVDFLAHVIAHELGHAVDVALNDGDDRDMWQTRRRIDDAPWWPENGANDFSTGAGDFAESFAAWQTGPGSFRSEIGALPSESDQELLIELSQASQ